ncbi:hypothetical protein [Pseudomonas saxonica]|nr:hypothetical protein [Pseudomonas saxonica]
MPPAKKLELMAQIEGLKKVYAGLEEFETSLKDAQHQCQFEHLPKIV